MPTPRVDDDCVIEYESTWVRRFYIYIISSPNLAFEIAIPGREREQGHFRGSREGAQGSKGEHRGSTMGQCRGAAGGNLKRLPRSRLELPSLFLLPRICYQGWVTAPLVWVSCILSCGRFWTLFTIDFQCLPSGANSDSSNSSNFGPSISFLRVPFPPESIHRIQQHRRIYQLHPTLP